MGAALTDTTRLFVEKGIKVDEVQKPGTNSLNFPLLKATLSHDCDGG